MWRTGTILISYLSVWHWYYKNRSLQWRQSGWGGGGWEAFHSRQFSPISPITWNGRTKFSPRSPIWHWNFCRYVWRSTMLVKWASPPPTFSYNKKGHRLTNPKYCDCGEVSDQESGRVWLLSGCEYKKPDFLSIKTVNFSDFLPVRNARSLTF